MTPRDDPRMVRSNGADGFVPDAAKAQFGLAHGWARKGHLDRALRHFRAAIELDPDLEGAHLKLASVLLDQRRWHDAVDACEAGLRHFPNQAVLHKGLTTALIELHGHDAAFARHGLCRIDDRPIEIQTGEVLGCLVVRNELNRVPWFLTENRRIGVTTFLVVDNDSTDGTGELLAGEPDVRLWRTTESFNAANFGSAWFEVLLRRYGLGHWAAMLDADEILCFPGYEKMSVRELCVELDRAGMRAMSGLMLDMYGRGPVASTHYTAGKDFLETCPYFDRWPKHTTLEGAGPFDNHTFHFGGARRRVFGNAVEYLITKTPLVRYDAEVVLAGGQHWTSHPAHRIAHDSCAVLHFKYFSSFVSYAFGEADREEHADSAQQYKAYRDALATSAELQLFDAQLSVRFESSQQLVDLGIVDEDWRRGVPRPATPIIAPRTVTTGSPRWSVMITVYRRLHTLARAVRSVLADAPPDAQIAVVADHHDRDTDREVRALLTSLDPDGRIELLELGARVGHPHVFNAAIERARGAWVHILHDDDWVRPGFYAALDAGIDRDPSIGAAFVRHELPAAPSQSWISWLEREDAGVVENWLDRIAIECRVQFSAMAVRRAVYEEVGGFRGGIGSAFDWEMWQRIASRHPVWFDPRPLAVVCRDGTAETDRLMSNGEQVADSVAAIEHARRHFPDDRVDQLTGRARERFALHGLDLAQTQLGAGDYVGALRNIAAALEASARPGVVAQLRLLLAELSVEGTA